MGWPREMSFNGFKLKSNGLMGNKTLYMSVISKLEKRAKAYALPGGDEFTIDLITSSSSSSVSFSSSLSLMESS